VSSDDELDEEREDLKYLEQAYTDLCKGLPMLSFVNFFDWEEVQALLSDGLCSKEEVEQMWLEAGAPTLQASIDFDKFLALNRKLDEMFEFEDDEDASEEEDEEEGSVVGEEEEEMDSWDPQYSPISLHEPEFLEYLKTFYKAHAKGSSKKGGGGGGEEAATNEGLSFEVFSSWEDVKAMLAEGDVDSTVLQELWSEAVMQCVKGGADIIRKGGALKQRLDLDAFIRLNIKLDSVLDEIAEAMNNLTDEDFEAYYMKEFEQLSQGEELISYQQLLSWPDLVEMIKAGNLSEEQVQGMWNALPKKPLGAFYKKKGFGNVAQADGINVAAFLNFNTVIDDLEKAEVWGEGEGDKSDTWGSGTKLQ